MDAQYQLSSGKKGLQHLDRMTKMKGKGLQQLHISIVRRGITLENLDIKSRSIGLLSPFDNRDAQPVLPVPLDRQAAEVRLPRVEFQGVFRSLSSVGLSKMQRI